MIILISGLAERLKEERIKCGYSQVSVSKRLGISTSIISGYETGERTPSVEILLSLSYLYGCSVDYLLGKQQCNVNNLISLDGLTKEQISAIISLVNTLR